jgi:nitrate reductase gamma subunit
MYQFVSGPLVWIAFIGFFAGSLYKVIAMARLAKRERVVLPTFDAKHGARSLLHWVVPFASTNMRARPLYSLLSYVFHLCVVLTPLFVMGHAILWQTSWGVRWWSLPGPVADIMTLVVIVACCVFMVRRLVRAEVRNVTYSSDFLLALVAMAPFLTGFVAHRQWLPYQPMLIAHIISGVVFLLVIPWTRLVHMIWFTFTRAYMGSEFGAVRHARDW